jgi:alpha-galactosidase
MSPRDGDVTANEYVAQDGKQAVLFAFRHSQEYDLPAPTIYLEGLDSRATYTVTYLGDRTEQHTGAYLMHNGLDLNLKGDYASTVVVLNRDH